MYTHREQHTVQKRESFQRVEREDVVMEEEEREGFIFVKKKAE
jgi:hypothetical protein